MNQNKKNNLIIIVISIVINILILVFFECLFYPLSETGDDSVMMVISSGGFGVETGYTVYISAIIGHTISLLNRLLPVINWYNAIQVLMVFISLLVITLCNLKRFGKLTGSMLSLAFLFIIGYECYVRFQFSKTAGILICAAGYLILNKYGKKIKIYDLIIFGILCIVSSMIRWEIFLIGISAFFAAILWSFFCYRVFDNIEWRVLIKQLLRVVIIYAIVFIAGFGLRTLNKHLYSNEEWSQYLSFNSARSLVRDYPILGYKDNEELYSEIGMSENDYNTLKTWNINDPDYFTTERLIDVSNIAKDNQVENTYSYIRTKVSLPIAIKSFVKEYLYILLNYNSFRLLVAMIIVTGLLAFTSGKFQSVTRWILTVIFAIVVMMGVLFYMYIHDRYGLNRIDITIVMTAVLITFSGTEAIFNLRLKSFILGNVAVLIAVVIYLSLIVFPRYSYYMPNLTKEEKMNIELHQEAAELIKMMDLNGDNFYFIDSSQMYQGMGYDFWKPIPFGYGKNVIWLGGWYTNSPILIEQESNLGIYNPYKTLASNDNAYFVTSNNNRNRGIVLDYLNEHYGDNICVKRIERYNYFSIYQYYVKDDQ